MKAVEEELNRVFINIYGLEDEMTPDVDKKDTETRIYEEKIHHLADQMISIVLDDGVKKNYAIFQDVLAKIK